MQRRPCHLPFALACALLASACGDDGAATADSGSDDARVDATNAVDALVADAASGDVPRIEAAGCRFSVPDAELGFTEGADYACGDLIVYENRDTPTTTISLHFIRFFSSSGSSNATIYLDGGPGGNGNNIVGYLGYLGQSFLDGLLVDGDFLVIAQRGTSLSIPALLCDDIACAELPGVHMPSYNTAFNADDVDDLRAALGIAKLNVYGISYGSRLGLEVLRRHGDNVRAAVLGGLVPAQVNWQAYVPASFYSALTALNASCVAHGACATAFGDLEAKFIAAFDSLNNEMLIWDYMGSEIGLDGYALASLLFQVLYSKSTYPWLPMMLSDLAERRTDRVGDFIANLFYNFGGGNDISTGLYYSVVCNELFNPPDESVFDTANAGVPAEILEIFGWNWYTMLNECASYPLGPQRPVLSQAVTSPVRTLLSSGALDPITPPSFGALAATTLTDKVVVDFANSGHGATLQSTCGIQTLLSFIADPSVDPDISCAANVTTDYVLPAKSALFSFNRAAIAFELSHAPPLPPGMREHLRNAIKKKK